MALAIFDAPDQRVVFADQRQQWWVRSTFFTSLPPPML
jgi:hypothetical protein